jgi:hypothetical protein
MLMACKAKASYRMNMNYFINSYFKSAKKLRSIWPVGCASHAVHHLLGLLEITRRQELVGKCKLASLWRAKLKPVTTLIASWKAQISFIIGRLECASQAVCHLLGLLEISRRHELVSKCKLASLWHAKLKPPTACIIIILLIVS